MYLPFTLYHVIILDIVTATTHRLFLLVPRSAKKCSGSQCCESWCVRQHLIRGLCWELLGETWCLADMTRGRRPRAYPLWMLGRRNVYSPCVLMC